MLRSHGQHVAQPEFEPRPSDSKAHTREHRAALPLRVLVTGGERMRAPSPEGHGGCGKAADGDENQTISHQSSVPSRPRPVAAAQCLPSVLSCPGALRISGEGREPWDAEEESLRQSFQMGGFRKKEGACGPGDVFGCHI